MALRHSRNRKGTHILTKLQEKTIRETLIFNFEKYDFVLPKTLFSLTAINTAYPSHVKQSTPRNFFISISFEKSEEIIFLFFLP
jgi:hypothetical protein